eukprot:CAMPEP_0198246416 /NCGR_PEP_ID=MMETSP1446-20131203/45961_1 /TAXON_ID=1461542 ORGANISM="Unidentified sp, Strain CCMP2111" /NCGR_SAMPLE_ID=MMETSP1446 /ASSEMBLY_ACC=CAM_ASM_001112 /LENGTH=527 /DNA_ID=CAMNT_0043930737 /DNA_START=552 /DNA_END=2135 /DNA_ORIENTATION=-
MLSKVCANRSYFPSHAGGKLPAPLIGGTHARGAQGKSKRRSVVGRVINVPSSDEVSRELFEYASSSSYLTSWEDSVCTLDHTEGCRLLRNTFDRDSKEPEFLQAVQEAMRSLEPLFIDNDPEFYDIFLRLLEPERVLIFRVAWQDDQGRTQVNRGYRVQFNSALGPYKGGLRFHPSVNLSILKFLAFEQTFKNALTGLPLGSAKGGSDFDPKDKSDGEIMRFCQSFMTELWRHVGPVTDVPAGDIGVGAREIGYLFGQYKRLAGRFEGAITGKGIEYGGSHIRPEATGYGLIYYLNEMVVNKDIAPSLKGMRCAISGSGNVAQYAAEKLLAFGALPLTMSDSQGSIFVEAGMTEKHLKLVSELKNVRRGRLAELNGVEGIKYIPGSKPWKLGKFDVALPCATQNELDLDDASVLVESGCFAVAEGANMPSTPSAIAYFEESGVAFGPAKAANAGGVAVSGLEMSQNAQGMQWSREEVEEQLRKIMVSIYKKCENGANIIGKNGNLNKGADVMGFIAVANAMKHQGCV